MNLQYNSDRQGCSSGLGGIFHLICSIVVVLTLNCKMEYMEGGQESSLLNGLYKLEHLFYFCNIGDVFILVAFFLLIQYVSRQDSRSDRWVAVFSVILSISYVVSMSYLKYDSTVFLFGNSYQLFLSTFCIVGYYLILYYCLRFLIICMERKIMKSVLPDSGNFFQRNFLGVSFLIIFFCWLPWITMNYPGTSEPDSTYQIS